MQCAEMKKSLTKCDLNIGIKSITYFFCRLVTGWVWRWIEFHLRWNGLVKDKEKYIFNKIAKVCAFHNIPRMCSRSAMLQLLKRIRYDTQTTYLRYLGNTDNTYMPRDETGHGSNFCEEPDLTWKQKVLFRWSWTIAHSEQHNFNPLRLCNACYIGYYSQ